MVISWVHRHAGYELQRATAKWNWIKNKAALVTKQTTGNWPLGFCSWLSAGSQEKPRRGKGKPWDFTKPGEDVPRCRSAGGAPVGCLGQGTL